MCQLIQVGGEINMPKRLLFESVQNVFSWYAPVWTVIILAALTWMSSSSSNNVLLHEPHTIKTKLNASLANIRQRADLFEANISASKISPPQCHSCTEREYYNGS